MSTVDISSSMSHVASQSATASAPRQRGVPNHHQKKQQLCWGSRRCFPMLLSFAMLILTILQYTYTFSLSLHSDDVASSQSGNAVLLQNFVKEREAAETLMVEHDVKSAAEYVMIGEDKTRVQEEATEEDEDEGHYPDPDYHMIFSSSCVPLQNWQSYLFFYSALKVGQRGNVTRIASGCNEKEAQALMKFHEDHIRPMSDRFHLHFTPDFSRVTLEQGKHPYKYMNKPYGVRHWMEHVLGLGNESNLTSTSVGSSGRLLDGIVMLLDPDIVLLRPLRHDFTKEEVLWAGKQNGTLTRVVRHGFPIAQQDGYLGNAWMNMNWSHITGIPEGQYLKPPSESRGDGEIYWNSGPPYLATVKDMYAIAVRWTAYSSRLLDDQRTGIYGEMYGYIIASYQLQLPHTLIASIVVSTTITAREGWPYIDQLAEDQVCRTNRNDDLPLPPSSPMPIGLHYCQRYMLGEHFFGKYRIKKKIIDCDMPLYAMPPADVLQRYNYSVRPGRADLKDQDMWTEVRDYVPPRRAKREAFMLCRLTAYLNDALRYYKERACGGDGKGGNRNETLSLYVDPVDR